MSGNTVGVGMKGSNWYHFERRFKVIAANAILVPVVFASLYPFVMMFMNSFKSNTEILTNPSGLPIQWTLACYAEVFQYHGGLLQNFLNSVFISTSSTLIGVFLCSMAAFAFAKYQFVGRDLMFGLLLATLMVPGEVTVPALYIWAARLGWLNTYQVQIIPTLTSVFGMFLIRQYMLSIPNALLDAAKIDGATHWKLYWHIMVPTSSPVLGAFAILHFMGIWNSYLWPLLVAYKRPIQPIMVVLPNLLDPIIGFIPVWGTIMAGCTLSTVPILIVFVAFQDRFMSSVTVGALKE